MPRKADLKRTIDTRLDGMLKPAAFNKMDGAQQNDTLKLAIAWYKATRTGDGAAGGWFNDDPEETDHD